MKNILHIACFLAFTQNAVFAQQSSFGVSLSGLEWNGTPKVPTAKELTYYSGKGLKLIRLPFLWERAQTTLGQPLDATYLATLDNVVAAASTAGVSIILDMHNYCRYPYNGTVINASGGPTIAQFASAWKLLATHFANQTTVWGYDLMNEPNTLGSGNHWFPMAQAAIDSIRLVDKNHVIIVEGENWSHGNTWTTYNAITANNLSALVDPNNNLVFEAHQYFDSNGSGSYSSTSFSGNGVTTSTGVTLITPFVNWLKQHNFKGMVGEYGIPGNNATDQASWNTLLDNFLAYLQSNCVLGTYWAGGPGWTYLTNTICIEPSGTTDAPQMAIVQKYTSLSSSCPALTTDLSSGNLEEAGSSAVISPNPFSDHAFVSLTQQNNALLTIEIRNLTGTLLQTFQGNASSEKIRIGSELSAGIYVVQISQNGSRILTTKLIKN
jgi:endoglucanase